MDKKENLNFAGPLPDGEHFKIPNVGANITVSAMSINGPKTYKPRIVEPK